MRASINLCDIRANPWSRVWMLIRWPWMSLMSREVGRVSLDEKRDVGSDEMDVVQQEGNPLYKWLWSDKKRKLTFCVFVLLSNLIVILIAENDCKIIFKLKLFIYRFWYIEVSGEMQCKISVFEKSGRLETGAFSLFLPHLFLSQGRIPYFQSFVAGYLVM